MHFKGLSCCSRENCQAKKKKEVAYMSRTCHATTCRIAMLRRVVAVHVSGNCHATSKGGHAIHGSFPREGVWE